VNKTNVCHTIVYRFRHTTYSQKYFTWQQYCDRNFRQNIIKNY
jgi:hypothetical protein